MWLINTHTLALGESVDEQAVDYVVLSHRRGKDEVTF